MKTNNQFIQQYTPLVRTIARQYSIPSIPQEDLMQEGFFGLLEAANHFDENRGITIQSYASCWVRKYICEAIRQYGYIVVLPQHTPVEHIYTEQLDTIVKVEDDEALTYEDILRSPDLQPDEQLELQEGLDAWKKLKNQQKTQKKRLPVGKFMQKYVNK